MKGTLAAACGALLTLATAGAAVTAFAIELAACASPTALACVQGIAR
jgi:hypothetical protein